MTFRYSNFVNFPIFIGEGDAARKVNTVQALWASMPQEVTTEEHEDFYKFVANAYDAPMYTLHFRTDAPIEIKSLFYIGQSHAEKYGMGRMEPGVSLYSRKVLIEAQSKALLPDWMRFVHAHARTRTRKPYDCVLCYFICILFDHTRTIDLLSQCVI